MWWESGDTVTISRELYEQYQKLDSLLEMMDVVDAYYYQDANEQDMLDGAASGLLYGLGDPYTFYYTAEDYAELWEEDEGNYAGVGIRFRAPILPVIAPSAAYLSNSPAREAGIHKGDILRKVDDLGRNSLYAQRRCGHHAWHPGEPVTLVVERNGEELTFTVNRGAGER